ncbi:MAG: hypothetical protein AMJ54_14230 [Deltaproteobacteria bacterium SG8_13]|nr:MAG: hypothetical protein AMJ54_14230 [Deltaproteobacteria bacterium SG8_13]
MLSNGKPENRWTLLLPPAVLLLLAIGFFHPVIFLGKTFYAFDALLQFYPWNYLAPGFEPHNSLITDPINVFYPTYDFYFQHIKQLSLPWWYPDTFCGKPFPSGIYPMNNPLVFLSNLLLPTIRAHDFVLWLHMLAAGIFMLLYLKELRLRTWAALIGAVGWMFNGHLMVWFEFEHLPIMAATLPAALFCLHRWLAYRSRLYCLCFTAAVSLSVTAGYSHVLIYELIFLLLYFVVLVCKLRRNFWPPGRNQPAEWVNLGVCLLLGVAISANFFTSSLILLDDSQRAEIPAQKLFDQTGQLPATYLATYIFPDFYGNPAGDSVVFTPRKRGLQPYNNYNELCVYAGVLPLFLVLVTAAHPRRRQFSLLYLATATVTLAMAMGSFLYYPLARWVIGLGYSTPTRILYLTGFSVVVAAAMGADIFFRRQDVNRRLVFSLWTAFAALAVAVALAVQSEVVVRWLVGPVKPADWLHDYPILAGHFALFSPLILYPLILVLLSYGALTGALFARSRKSGDRCMALVLLILAADLGTFGLKYNTASPVELAYPPTGAIRFLMKRPPGYRVIAYGNFLDNTLAPYRVPDIGGHSSFYPRRFGEFLFLSQNNLKTPLPETFDSWVELDTFGSPLLDLLNSKYILMPPGANPDAPNLRLLYDKEISIYENLAAFPRAFIVADFQYCEDRQSAYRVMGSWRNADFRNKAILEEQPPIDLHTDATGPSGSMRQEVKQVRHQTNRVEIDIRTEGNGLLVLSESHHPGWRATIDGRPARILRANYVLQAVAVGAGDQTVVFEFDPAILKAGLAVTCGGWLALGTLLAWSLWVAARKSRRHRQTEPLRSGEPPDT